jgi:hypothetical protein
MNKKVAAIGVAAGLVLGGAGAAFAYFTTSSTGAGSASVGSQASWSIATTSAVGSALTPSVTDTSCPPSIPSAGATGDCSSSQTLTYTVTNHSGVQEALSGVTISVANADGSPWAPTKAIAADDACSASDFSIDGNTVGTPFDDTSLAGPVNPGVTTSSSNVSVILVDNSANQDNCEGLTHPLYFVAS